MSSWNKQNEKSDLVLNSRADLTLIYIQELILYHGSSFLTRLPKIHVARTVGSLPRSP